jgi:soluble lytic murein transglycosylase
MVQVAVATPLDEARRHLAAGDCARAVATLPSPVADPERLAIGRCYLRLGQPRKAIETLDPALDGPFASYAALLSGEAGLVLGRPAEAAQVLSLAQLSGPSARRARMLRGRAQIEAGDHYEGRDTLRPLLQTEIAAPGFMPSPLDADPAEVRWWLAEGARKRGETERAIPVWQTIWTHNPTSEFAQRAADRLAAYGTAPPHPSSAGGRELITARIQTLQKMNLHREALALSRMLPQDSSPAGVKAQSARAFKGRDYPLAVSLYAQISAPTPSERFNHALATSRTGDYDSAARLYRALVDAHPTHSKADFASYKIGYLSYDANDLEEAVVLLRQHLQRYPESRHGDEARWFIGWSLYRLGQAEAADSVFAELRQKHGRSSLAVAARYWQARIAENRGDTETATAGFEAVLRNWPLSGYAWFSADKLGRRYEAVPIVAIPEPPEALRGVRWDQGNALAAVGLDAWARELLAELIAPAKAAGRTGRLAMAHALIAAGDYVTAKSLAQSYCASPTRGGDPIAQQACYPRPQGTLVDATTSASGLNRNLPYAIMTAESALRPEVSSPAGARGLMQLMPELGAELHTRLGYAWDYDPDQLFQPGYNASLGVTELSRLQEQFGGLPMTIAGYNGGAEAVERWLSQQGGDPQLDVFAENVGYTETRRYVRKVLGYLQAYRFTYGD